MPEFCYCLLLTLERSNTVLCGSKLEYLWLSLRFCFSLYGHQWEVIGQIPDKKKFKGGRFGCGLQCEEIQRFKAERT